MKALKLYPLDKTFIPFIADTWIYFKKTKDFYTIYWNYTTTGTLNKQKMEVGTDQVSYLGIKIKATKQNEEKIKKAMENSEIVIQTFQGIIISEFPNLQNDLNEILKEQLNLTLDNPQKLMEVLNNSLEKITGLMVPVIKVLFSKVLKISDNELTTEPLESIDLDKEIKNLFG